MTDLFTYIATTVRPKRNVIPGDPVSTETDSNHPSRPGSQGDVYGICKLPVLPGFGFSSPSTMKDLDLYLGNTPKQSCQINPKSIIQSSHERAEKDFAQAQDLLEQGDLAAARKQYNAALKRYRLSYKTNAHWMNWAEQNRYKALIQLYRGAYFHKKSSLVIKSKAKYLDKANGAYSSANRFSYKALWKSARKQESSGDAESFIVRARYHNSQREYKKAIENYDAAVKIDPAYEFVRDVYKQLLSEKARNYAEQQGQAKGDSSKQLFHLTEQIKIAEALGNQEQLKSLSAQLAPVAKDQALQDMLIVPNMLVNQGHLELKDLSQYAQYFVIESSEDESKQLKFTDKFQKLEPTEKANLIKEITRIGLIKQNKQMAQKEAELADAANKKADSVESSAVGKSYHSYIDAAAPGWESNHYRSQAKVHEAKQLYYQQKVSLLEGRLETAQLEMRRFKAKSKGTKDPELLIMREEVRASLRRFSLASIARLKKYNEAISSQRLNRWELKMYKRQARDRNDSLFSQLEGYITDTSNDVDTLDEALVYFEADYARLQDNFWGNAAKGIKADPHVRSGWRVNFNHQKPRFGSDAYKAEKKLAHDAISDFEKDKDDPRWTKKDAFPGVSYAYVEAGGTLYVHNYPAALRIIIGKGTKPAIIRTGFSVKKFSPSPDEDRVAFITSNGYVSANAKWNNYGTYKSHSGEGWMSSNYYGEHPDSLNEEWSHYKFFKTRDNLMWRLLQTETQEGLEKRQTPEGKREQLLKTAKLLRQRNGSYSIAAHIFEGLFQDQVNALIAEMPEAKVKAIETKVRAGRAEARKKVLKQLEKNGRKDKASESDIDLMVESYILNKIYLKLRDIAFRKLSSKHFGDDKIAKAAWSQYEDMLDPNDETWNLADSSWDTVTDEIVFNAITMPFTMGIGAGLRLGMSGTRFITGGVARGGWRALATRSVYWGTSVTAEALSDELFRVGFYQKSFDYKNVGVGVVMFGSFHGGGATWAKSAKAIGIGQDAIMVARSNGQSWKAFALSTGNFAGTINTQTLVATSLSYAEDMIHDSGNSQGFWQRHVNGFGKMLAFHYGSRAFGRNAMEMDQLASFRLNDARVQYETSLAAGYSKKQALDHALGLQPTDFSVLGTTGPQTSSSKLADIFDFSAYVAVGLRDSLSYYLKSRAENKKAQKIADSKKPKKQQPEDYSEAWGNPKGQTDGDGWAAATKTSKKATKARPKVANDNKAVDPHATADLTGGKRPEGVESGQSTTLLKVRRSEQATRTAPGEATTTAINHKTFIVDRKYVEYYTSQEAKAEYQRFVDNFDAIAKEMNWSAAEKASYKNQLIRFKEHLDFLEKKMNLTSTDLSTARSTERSHEVLSEYSRQVRPRLDKLQANWYDQMHIAANQRWTNARAEFRVVESTMTALEIRSQGAFNFNVKLKSTWDLRHHIDPTNPSKSFQKVKAHEVVSYDIRIADPAKARKALANDHYFSEKQRLQLAQYLVVEKGWSAKQIDALFGSAWLSSHMKDIQRPAAVNQ